MGSELKYISEQNRNSIYFASNLIFDLIIESCPHIMIIFFNQPDAGLNNTDTYMPPILAYEQGGMIGIKS